MEVISIGNLASKSNYIIECMIECMIAVILAAKLPPSSWQIVAVAI
jgi:hypothetical protein